MPAFCDARCKCGKKIGWVGEMTDRPKCPACGHRPSDAELKKAQEGLDRDRALLEKHIEAAEAKKKQCCPRDTEGDGNCDIHSSPGVLRKKRG